MQTQTISLEERIARWQATFAGQFTSSPVADAPPSFACDVCEDRGVVRVDLPYDHPQFGKLFPCPNPNCPTANANRASASARLLKRSGLPAKYAALNFNTWYALPDYLRAGKELAAASAWLFARGGAFTLDEAAATLDYALIGADEPREWLVLQGGLGVGKTGLAAAAMNQMALVGRAALYYRVGDLFADVQSRYGQTEGASADQLLEEVKSAPALILDEMNVPRVSDDKQRIIEEIIRYRHGRDLPTLITCNVDAKAFAAMWGERTADVIFEQAHWIIVKGERLRRRAEIKESF